MNSSTVRARHWCFLVLYQYKGWVGHLNLDVSQLGGHTREAKTPETLRGATMPNEDNAEGESVRSVEHRLRRLLGAATTRFEHWRSDMRQLENYKAQHDDLLQGLETLLQVSSGGARCSLL